MSRRYSSCLCCLFQLVFCGVSVAQDPGDARPVVGLRENAPDLYFLKDARIVVEPGVILDVGSVSIRGTSIIAVGANITPPSGAEVIDCTGQTIYAGLIDAYGEVDVPDPVGGVNHWNGNVLPRRSAATALRSVSGVTALRSQGVTTRLIAPSGAIVKGTSCLVSLDRTSSVSLLRDDIAQHLQLTVPRDKRRDDYPNSPMGAVALLRQTLADAQWYPRAWKAYQADPSLQKPTRNDDLDRLARDSTSGRFVIDAPNERMALRADQLAREYSLDIAIRGSGREYRDLQRIASSGRTLLLPVDFPDAPDVTSEAASDEVTLLELMHWNFARQNPARLNQAGVSFCLTSMGLDDPKDFLGNVRKAVDSGLSADAALASLTTVPARWLGIDDVAGRVAAGRQADLLIADGDLFDDQTKVVETWVIGKRFRTESAAPPKHDPLIGTWETKIRVNRQSVPVRLVLERAKKKVTGKIFGESVAADPEENPDSDSEPDAPGEDAEKQADAEPDAPDQRSANLNRIARTVDRLTAWSDLNEVDDRLPTGPARITIVTVVDQAAADRVTLFSSVTFPGGQQQTIRWRRASETEDSDVSETQGEATDNADETAAADDAAAEDSDQDEQDADASALDEIVVNYPLGGYGTTEPIERIAAVLFRGATVWTCGDSGVLPNHDVLVVDGKIVAIGAKINPPADCVVVDASGKHITPGLIDCHSHMATDGGVNESGQAVTAEVRVGDFVDNSDINIYRQLAGGLTIANILHGSANPIGGQNQVIKLRWGDSMRGMKMASAPAGIKFALGENVKRSNRSSPQTRYPSSRMGVEQLFRDRFLAAKEYAAMHKRWDGGTRDGLPPRRDLELEAIAEIIRGQRWIHCHSYRQDEIVALLDLLDEFGITIGTLQHILEGYKVADRMLQHGAMASAFSDWWAYKFEVYDAIPDNGAIMHDVGIVVSFNSDDRELARHLNTEAAKAMKYGGVPAEQALKFVTLNPAKQLRIDDHVGSIEIGKDADLVLWSGPPLSTLSRCEQTWIDGRPMFSLERDRQIRQRDANWRSLLISQVLDRNAQGAAGKDKQIDEEDRWLRYDEFCHGHDHADDGDHDHDHHHHDHADADQDQHALLQQGDKR